MRHRVLISVLALIAVATTACTGIAKRQALRQEKLDRFMDYAGPPIDRIVHLGRYDSWTVLSDEKLVVFTNVNDAYLLTVARPCTGLQFTNRIALTSTGSTVSRGFDSVRFDRERCQITDIRKVDYRKMKQDLRESQ